MRPIKIIVDSTSDLTKEYLESNGITVLPLGISFKEESYLDGHISVQELYDKVTETKLLPKTFAISIPTFQEEFQKWIDQGYDILFIGISSQMSSVYQNAYVACQDFPGHALAIDSMNLSSGIGLIVLKAVDYRKEGLSLQEIHDKLMSVIIPNVRSQFVIETLDYLYKGGRCSSLAFLFGKGFHIRPLIRVKDGKMIVYRKPRGKMKNALNELLEVFKQDLPNIDPFCVMITHSLASEYMHYLKEELEKIIPNIPIMVTEAGCVISSHCGKGTIGILYIVKA